MGDAVGLMEMTVQASGESKRKANTLENGTESSAKARRKQASEGHKVMKRKMLVETMHADIPVCSSCTVEVDSHCLAPSSSF